MALRRTTVAASGAGIAALAGCLSLLVMVQDASGKAPADPCGESAGDRQDVARILDDVAARRSPTAAVRLKSAESRLRPRILAAADDDTRQQLQDLFDDLAAARAAIETGAEQTPELTALLRSRLAAFARRC